jgi:hypothetical protein
MAPLPCHSLGSRQAKRDRRAPSTTGAETGESGTATSVAVLKAHRGWVYRVLECPLGLYNAGVYRSGLRKDPVPNAPTGEKEKKQSTMVVCTDPVPWYVGASNTR